MKKRIIYSVLFCLLGLSNAIADEIVIGDVTVPQGGTADLAVGFAFTNNTDKVGFTLSLALPEGLNLLKDSDGDIVYEQDATSIAKLNINIIGDGNIAGMPANETATIKGMSGTLLTLKLCADATLEVGSTHTVNVTNATFLARTNESVQDVNLPPFSFTVTIGEPADTRILLDENSTTAPETFINVDVHVKRTINANEWSTICLPFAMTETQVKEVFGEDVQLADFAGTEEPEYDGNDNVVAVTANFTDVQSIEANHPYVIKVSSAVTEFTVDGVDIVTNEDEAYIEFDNGLTGRRRVVYSGFYGTYHAQTVLDEFTLFLSGNQFWYSTGLTKMKAFRAYFYFLDILTDVENGSANVKIYINAEDDPTGIHSKDKGDLTKDNTIYNLAGQRVSKSYKGIIIDNGKK